MICFEKHISIFLRAVVLQTDSPTERIDNPTFRVDSPTKPILAVFSPTNRWSYHGGNSMVLINSRTMDTVVKTSVFKSYFL